MNIDDLTNENLEIINNNSYKKRKNGLILKDKWIEVLERYSINFEVFGSLNELIYEIEEALEECDYPEDLDIVSSEISEFNYYNNTKK